MKLPDTAAGDPETMAATMCVTGGNFRLLNRLLTQMERILEIDRLSRVTKSVVEAASELAASQRSCHADKLGVDPFKLRHLPDSWQLAYEITTRTDKLLGLRVENHKAVKLVRFDPLRWQTAALSLIYLPLSFSLLRVSLKLIPVGIERLHCDIAIFGWGPLSSLYRIVVASHLRFSYALLSRAKLVNGQVNSVYKSGVPRRFAPREKQRH